MYRGDAVETTKLGLASRHCLELTYLILQLSLGDDHSLKLRTLDNLNDSLPFLAALLFVLHEVLNDLLVPKFDVERVGKQCKQVPTLCLRVIKSLF